MRLFHSCARLAISVLVACSLVTSIVQPAFAQIAPGVTQSAAQIANVTGSVIDSDGHPVAGATVTITGQGAQQAKVTDEHGAFAFNGIPFGTYLISVNSSLGQVNKPNIVVDRDLSVSVAYEAKPTATGTSELKTIAKVTTKAIGVHINDTAASIASLNPRDYAFQGNDSWQHLLEAVPGVALSGSNDGGLGVNSIAGSPFVPVVLSINGALPYETSTTMDGMPFSNNTLAQLSDKGSADLGPLNPAAFDTADIIRGPGANAPSILDSIGGSLILHAPGAVTGNHLTFSTYNDPYGGVTYNSLLELKLGTRLSATFGYLANNSPGPQHYSHIAFTNFGTGPIAINGQTFYGCGHNDNFNYDLGFYFGYGNCFNYNTPTFFQSVPVSSALYNMAGCNKYVFCFNAAQVGMVWCCVAIDTSWTKHNYSLGLNYRISSSVTAQVFYAGSSAADNGGNIPLSGFDFQPTPGYSGAFPTGVLITQQGSYGGAARDQQSTQLTEERISAFIGHGVLRVAGLQNSAYYNFTFCCHSAPPDGRYQVYGTGFFCTDPNCANVNL